MAMISPIDSGGETTDHYGGSSAHGSGGDSAGGKSPLHMNLGFLKGLTEKKMTRDGQPPKRRGPKPDSKPALTRRQELNRQAQRTHRERKEIYIKALEEQLMHLKETFSGTVQEKNAIAEENKRLKDLLRAHGIMFPGSNSRSHSAGLGTGSYTESSADSRSGSYNPTQGFSPPTTVYSDGTSPTMREASRAGNELIGGPQVMQQQQGVDHDQAGIDFVLALERPCMAHQQYMCVRSDQEPEAQISGHALMATCPPLSHISTKPDEPYPHKTWDIPNPDLLKLLDLSKNLPLDGELTPIMALSFIRSDERYIQLTMDDFQLLIDNLKEKSRCYGFGAVLEEFEVRDALSSVFAAKFESYVDFV